MWKRPPAKEEAIMASDRDRQPYEGPEAQAKGDDYSAIDPDELTGPGGRLPAVDGLTEADDPKEAPGR
jgi:hypothetical protein